MTDDIDIARIAPLVDAWGTSRPATQAAQLAAEIRATGGDWPDHPTPAGALFTIRLHGLTVSGSGPADAARAWFNAAAIRLQDRFIERTE